MDLQLPPNVSLQNYVASLPEPERNRIIRQIPEHELLALEYTWRGWKARPNQLAPGTPGSSNPRKDWRYWLLKAGRGYGKTRTGAETVREWEQEGRRRIHLIAPTAAAARDVMVEGPGGLLSCYPEGDRPYYEPSKTSITWRSGCLAKLFSSEEPERLRGPQAECCWLDEIAAYKNPIDTWDNMAFGLRLGDDPRAVCTTTPKPVKLIRQLMAHPKCVVTGGSTYENRANLAPGFFSDIISKYEGTRLGRQELLAELLDDIPGALWKRERIDELRVTLDKVPQLVRVVIAIDPAVTANEDSDETGIVAAGLGINGHVYVLEDSSLRASPNEWARTALKLFLKWNADRVVAETNNGGDLVEAVLRSVHPGVPFRKVTATRGKQLRAEPVASLYERGIVHHVGSWELLEDQMAMWVPGATKESPDRLDALVWAATDLVISPQENLVVTYDFSRQISPY